MEQELRILKIILHYFIVGLPLYNIHEYVIINFIKCKSLGQALWKKI